MSKKTKYRFDQYVREAAVEDFELVVDDEKTIRIKAPTGEQVFQAQQLGREQGDPAVQVRFICGDATEEILSLLKAAPAGVINALLGDIMRHFGMDVGEAPASST